MQLFGKHRIYLDYASATPLMQSAARAMREAEQLTGNPGSIHDEGVRASRSLQNSRARIARELGCKPREIIFTSGITESNNLAILGFARSLEMSCHENPASQHKSDKSDLCGLRGTHWIASAIEHSSVLECFAEIERKGGKISYAEPDSRGIISPESVAMLLRRETVCISVGWANNEIGVIQPLSSIARVIRAHEKKHGTRVIFHSDAGQAPLYLSATAHSLGVDLLSVGAAKLYGPHGIGALYVNGRAEPAPIFLGGGQERGLRSGTENVALAAGFAEAFECIARERATESKRLGLLCNELLRGLDAGIPGIIVNGDSKHALPHMLNISVPRVGGEYMTLSLDRAGIFISTKSACGEGTEKESHVIAALGGEPWRAENSLRFSLGRDTTGSDVRQVVTECAAIVSRLRPR